MGIPKNFISKIAIGLILLVHLSGMIGISMGYQNWFLSKTPYNLLLGFILLTFIFPLDSVKKWGVVILFFLVGMSVEWLGVRYGLLFGEYTYGKNLGPKIHGVPWIIGLNWALLAFITGVIANRFSDSISIRIILGAFLMVFLDLFMECTAPAFDFWFFEQEPVPLSNYIAWFLIAAIMHLIFQLFQIKGHFWFCFSLYLTQLIFFIYFYVFFHI